MSSNIQLILKRLIDILLSLIGLVLLTVPFAITSLAIKLDSKGPVFFRQERVGKDGRSFKVWKFRTMVVGAERRGARYGFEPNDPRITRTGKILRMTGVDELPQLINVLKGEMSLVGPRPTLLYQVEMYNKRQQERLTVKPGITGWALIHGRNELKWTERIEYDLWYIENFSLWIDLQILFKTLKVVALQEGLRIDQWAGEVEDFERERDKMLETLRLVLRPLERTDLTEVKKWKNDERVKRTLLGFSKGFSEDDIVEWYDRVRASKSDIRYGLELKENGKLIGMVGLYNIDWRNQKAEYGILIGDPTCWNQGLGSEATLIMIRYAFHELNLHRLYLNVLSSHIAAICLYEKCGFRKEGELREDYFRGGKYCNAIIMGLLEQGGREILEGIDIQGKC